MHFCFFITHMVYIKQKTSVFTPEIHVKNVFLFQFIQEKEKDRVKSRSFLLHELSFGRILHSRGSLDEDCQGNIPKGEEPV